jgi:hypothetical protein
MSPMAKQPPPEPLVRLPTRVAWWLWAYLTWPWQVRQLKREGFRRVGWMAWESGPPGRRPVNEMAGQPRTDSKADDPIGELRFELGARTRQLDRVRRDFRALTEEVITALSTDEHQMVMRGGLPFCQCRLPLDGGDASGVFITHILAVSSPHKARTGQPDTPGQSGGGRGTRPGRTGIGG